MNRVLAAVIAIFVICFIMGFARGFIKLMVSLLTVVIVVIIIIYLTPYTSKAIYKWTPIEEMVQKECQRAMVPDEGKIDLTGIKIGDVDLSILGEVDLGRLGELNLGRLGIEEKDILELLKSIELPKETQNSVIEKAKIPRFFKQGLVDNNNKEVYKELKVKNFPDYAGAYLAKIIINIIAFLVTFLIAIVVVKIIIYALAIMEELPVIHGTNRLAGGLAGLVLAVIIVWIAFMVITLLYNTSAGKECFVLIGKSRMLTILYDNNPILKWVTAFR